MKRTRVAKSRRRKSKTKRRTTRRLKKSRVFSRRQSRRYKGGANLPVPEGSVVGVDLDPQDPYSVPVLLNKAVYEEEILEN